MAKLTTEKMEQWARRLLPSPFTIAILLTVITWTLAFVTTYKPTVGSIDQMLTVLSWWEKGLWSSGLLAFAIQMMLILVLGHTLALRPLANRVTQYLVAFCKTTTSAVIVVATLTMVVGFFNWGLGLVLGAIFARKVGDQAQEKGLPIHYGLVGAAGYSGMLVWHGGLSGSAPLKAAEPGHISSFVEGYSNFAGVPLSETIFSAMNGAASILILLVIPFTLWLLARKASPSIPEITKSPIAAPNMLSVPIGAEKLDNSKFLGKIIGLIILLFALIKPTLTDGVTFFNLLTPNFVNFILLGMSLVLHHSIRDFLWAIDEAIGGVSGILIQFPLYFGIIGVINESGLATELATFFSQHSTATSFPLFTFISAAIINIFVPSGGGQWSVQAPILIKTAQSLGLSEGKCIMALAYGDQLTNMLQPFWALPLLGITGLKAKEILPYTIVMMVAAAIVFGSVLILF